VSDNSTRLEQKIGARPGSVAMSFTDHLSELRRRLVICVVAFLATTIATYVLYARILDFLEHPLCEALQKSQHLGCNELYVTGPLEAFGVRLNVSAYGGIVLAAPVILYELWRFVTPGLKAQERRYALPFVFATMALFLTGAYVAWLTFPHALGFLHAAGGPGIKDIFSPSKYLNLIMALMAIFGLTFEFPVVLVALELAGVLSPAQLAHSRRFAIIAIVVVAAVITPSSDPFSMLAMAIPMLIFYEMSILIGKLLHR
jgi:sec-independent protein translocase protein TatC